MEIDKSVVQEMRKEVFQALNAIASRHGLNVKQQSNVSYSATDFSVKYTFSDADINLAKADFEKKCWKYGLSASDYGRTFDNDGKTIVITGINTRAPKYPIQYTVDDRGMKCAPDYMMAMITKAG